MTEKVIKKFNINGLTVPIDESKITELEQNIGKIDSDAIHITDSFGNIIMTIDSNGINTTDIQIKSGKMCEVISNIIESLSSKLEKEIDSTYFQVQDANGNVAFRIDSDGVHTPKSDQWIVSMILGDTYIPISIEREQSGEVISAEIIYPDGNSGSISIIDRDVNGVISMHISYMDRDISVTVTRDSQGNINKISIN